MKLSFTLIAGWVGMVSCFISSSASAQAPVRGLPGAQRVYNYGAYGNTLPLSPTAYPQPAGYPAGMVAPNTAYRPVVGYVPAGAATNGYVTAGYAPVGNGNSWAGVTTGYAPVQSGYPPVQSGYAPAPNGYAAPIATGYAPAPLATPAAAPTGYMTPVYSPFVRPAPNYTPPNFAYRPSYAPNAVTYYRPVTVNDPVTGVPVTYMAACRGTECRPQPQTSYFGSLFGNHKSCGSCASGNCGTRPAAAPYYPGPTGVLPGATIPQQQVIVPTTPTTPFPNFQQPPPAIAFPAGNPAGPRTTIPPPGTVFPQGSIAPPSSFTPSPGGAIVDPANSRPALPNPPTTLSPSGANPGVQFQNYAPATDANNQAAAATVPTEVPQSGQPYTNDGKTFYYYRGTVKEAFSESAAQSAPTGTGSAQQANPTSTQRPVVEPPVIQPPANSSVPYPQYTPGSGPLRLDVRPSGLTSEPAPTTTHNNRPVIDRDYLDGSRTVPVNPAPMTTAPGISTTKPLPINPAIRPLPDPEPNGPVNRAPQLLNPRDKTA